MWVQAATRIARGHLAGGDVSGVADNAHADVLPQMSFVVARTSHGMIRKTVLPHARQQRNNTGRPAHEIETATCPARSKKDARH